MIAAGHRRRAIAHNLTLAAGVALHGVTREALSELLAIPELAEHLAAGSLDEAAAEHYRLFGMNVFPYASAFLDSSRLLGGAVTAEALGYFDRAGFRPTTTAEGPDHLGHEWMFTAYLLQVGSDELLGHFLHAHLLPWLLPLHLAVKRQDSPFFEALTAFGLSQVETCLAELALPPSEPLYSFPAPAAGLLQDTETRLKDIAEFLLTPVHAGIYLSRENLAALGRQTRVPRGFGDRAQLLSNLFHAAADYDSLDGVVGLLLAEVDGWIAGYASWESRPAFGKPARFWKARALGTRQVLENILAAIS